MSGLGSQLTRRRMPAGVITEGCPDSIHQMEVGRDETHSLKRSMSTLQLTMIGVGWLYARRHAPDMSAINRVNMDLFAPALIFTALAGRDFSDVAKTVSQAVAAAHIKGDVPNMTLTVPKRDEEGFASLVCFFEMSCALSAYISGVNPLPST